VNEAQDQPRGSAALRSGHTPPENPRLTGRELEVVRLMSEALTNQQIASRLGISSNTVRRHAANLFAKLGAVSRLDAVRHSVEQHLV
jgi:DNA-binding CsgD family transcriptional regulator